MRERAERTGGKAASTSLSRINVRRALHRLQDMLAMVDKNLILLQQNCGSVSEEVDEIDRRLAKALKDRTEQLRQELDRYLSTEVRNLTQLKENLEQPCQAHLNEHCTEKELKKRKKIFVENTTNNDNNDQSSAKSSSKPNNILTYRSLATTGQGSPPSSSGPRKRGRPSGGPASPV
ncbi:hypothetical protein FOCC_FOCC012890 [Frankliniella occidentalis]|nr:hypothetical protein FOCC_FOCC012890 [Frankliniella occidentalis]